LNEDKHSAFWMRINTVLNHHCYLWLRYFLWIKIKNCTSKYQNSIWSIWIKAHNMLRSLSLIYCTHDFFYVTGPSYAIDTACSSSLLAMDQALHNIRSGLCDAAIVGGSNLCLKPTTSLQFQKLGMLSKEGTCKSFDESGKFISAWNLYILYKILICIAKRINLRITWQFCKDICK
jgi:hypothetical protein